jgi:hypothetical protein
VSQEQFLEYEVALLLARYGENKVAAALAARLGVPTEVLLEKLRQLAQVKPRQRNKKVPDLGGFVRQLALESPQTGTCLLQLFKNFENRTFLPELKDVKRFFDRHGTALGSVRSRTEAAHRLFRLLASLGLPELDSLCVSNRHEGLSSLGIISDEILRRHR